MSNYMFKGIECEFTDNADTIVPSNEEKSLFLETFFSYEPINSVKWLNRKNIEDAKKTNRSLPIYRISNGSNELFLWPMLVDSDLLLLIESADDRPDLREGLARSLPKCF